MTLVIDPYRFAAPPPSLSRVLYDTFSSGGTNILANTPDEGGPWTARTAWERRGSPYNYAWSVTSNFGNWYVSYDTATTGDMTIIIGHLVSPSGDNEHGPFIRGDVDGVNSLTAQVGGSAVTLYKVISGTFTSLGSWSHGQTAPITLADVTISVEGDDVSVDVGGTTRITHTLTSGEKAVLDSLGHCGFRTRARGSFSEEYDNVEIWA